MVVFAPSRLKNRKIYWMAAAALVLLIAGVGFLSRGVVDKQTYTVKRSDIRVVVAAAGRTEGVTEEIRVSSRLPGKLRRVYVEEGDRVEKGKLLAELENADYAAQVEAARAEYERAGANYEKMKSGMRAEEVLASRAQYREAVAVEEKAKADADRSSQLFADGWLSREQLERSQEDLKVAQARVDTAKQNLDLMEKGYRKEDVEAARADEEIAAAKVHEAESLFDYTRIYSPITGKVLRLWIHEGETVQGGIDMKPVFTLSDDSTINVRAEVDESDISKVSVGLPAEITIDAFPGSIFHGKVFRLSKLIGKKKVIDPDPNSKEDLEVLETLIRMAPGTSVPLGLRVHVRILSADERNALTVPIRSLFYSDGKLCVTRRVGKSWQAAAVQTGPGDGRNIVIRKGLNEGDLILVK